MNKNEQDFIIDIKPVVKNVKDKSKEVKELEKLKIENERVEKFTQDFIDQEINRRINEYSNKEAEF